MIPLSRYQHAQIITNIDEALTNIDTLENIGYSFLLCSNGFESHHNLENFIDYYKFYSLSEDILKYAELNTFEKYPSNVNTIEYYQSRAKVYEKLVRNIKLFNKQVI